VETILFVAASPVDQRRLRTEAEFEAVRDELRQSDARGHYHIDCCFAATVDSLEHALVRVKPHYLHLSCHGEQGDLILAGEAGRQSKIRRQDAIDLLLKSRQLKGCIILACEGGPIAEALVPAVAYSVGLAGALSDRASLAYSKAFYRSLFGGEDLQTRHERGLGAINRLETVEECRPELFTAALSAAPVLKPVPAMKPAPVVPAQAPAAAATPRAASVKGLARTTATQTARPATRPHRKPLITLPRLLMVGATVMLLLKIFWPGGDPTGAADVPSPQPVPTAEQQARDRAVRCSAGDKSACEPLVPFRPKGRPALTLVEMAASALSAQDPPAGAPQPK